MARTSRIGQASGKVTWRRPVYLLVMKHEIEKDIWNWIKEYIEVPHAFYDYKFAPCPYAKNARLNNEVDVVAYTDGNIKEFIQTSVDGLMTNQHFNQQILVFPPSLKWNFYIRWFIKRLNRKTVPLGYYIQYGGAKNTTSKYPGLKGPYVLVIINKLSNVIAGHRALLGTNYYANWTSDHYHAVVERRQEIIDEYEMRKSSI